MGGKTSTKVAARIAAASLFALLLLSASLQASFVLLTRSGLENLVTQRLLPYEQRLDRIASRTQTVDALLTGWKQANLHTIHLWPGFTRVEYFRPGGIPAGSTALDVPPQIIGGRTMVPLRFVGDALGADVTWNGESRQVVYSTGDRRIVLTIDQNMVIVGNRTVEIDTPPMIVSGRTMVPIRFVSQWLGAAVRWNSAEGLVEISYFKRASG